VTAAPRREDPVELSLADGTVSADVEPVEWVRALGSSGVDRDLALKQLHLLMLRAARHQANRMRTALPDPSSVAVEVLVNQAADEAMTALLGKLHTFEGRSRFTTWAFKFAVLQVASDVRRMQWQHREVELRDLDMQSIPSADHDGPQQQAEANDLAKALARSMVSVLTPHQRRVAIALLVDGVPIDVLAERLGTSRGALYKTIHDVRGRLRADLSSQGYLPLATARSADRPVQSLAGTS
jgi:RNA polymerase sigma-70 factor (ECF subfamily)